MSDLAKMVGERAEADGTLSDEAKLVVWAALDGDRALASLASYERPTVDRSTSEASTVEPAGAFLRRITVQGFRGIGSQTTLELKPGPGLTVVAGRNGSGKSSLAEALELAVTGQTYRFEKKSAQWKDVWRNLHDGESPKIGVDLAEEGEKSTHIELTWAPEAGLSDVDATVQRHGKPREEGLGSLGWAGPAQTYRPLLTYDELGSLLTSERSKLYDALATVLGMEELAAAIKRIGEHIRTMEEPAKRAKQTKRELQDLLANLEDERAVPAARLIKAAAPDTTAIRALATGADARQESVAGQLAALIGLGVPSEQAVLDAATEVTDAQAALAAAGDRALEPLERRLALVDVTLSIHAHEGEQTCPVCGVGTLDDDRAEQLHEEATRARSALADLRNARGRLADAAGAARDLMDPVPACVLAELPSELDALRTSLLAAWTEWAAAPAEPLALADHLLTSLPVLSKSLAALQKAAMPVLVERDDAWARVATRLAAYADEADAAAEAKPLLDAAKAALKWLKENDTEIKNQRLAPIRDQAKEIWETLRQRSNVEISGLELKGTSTQRRVEIASAVDGKDAGGMAVLSQGELHALALALFLPRASLPESPFRFVVLDDPVQAMDPSKVDGLLKVLSDLAATRQVVVFSHDDRLAAAVRRSATDATLVQVSRGADSYVSVDAAQDLAMRYLDDAEAMAKDGKLPDETKRRLLPGMLRMAIEAAAHDRYFSQSLAGGASLDEVETRWTAAKKTSTKVKLALYGDPQRELQPWLSRGYRRRGLGISTSGFHQGLSSDDPVGAYNDVRSMVSDLRAVSK